MQQYDAQQGQYDDCNDRFTHFFLRVKQILFARSEHHSLKHLLHDPSGGCHRNSPSAAASFRSLSRNGLSGS